MKYGLKDEHYAAILELLRANRRVDKIVLYGSRAMGTFTTDSDVDICLFGDRLTLTDQGRLSAALEALPIPQQVDLVLNRKIKNEALLDHITRQGEILWVRGDEDV